MDGQEVDVWDPCDYSGRRVWFHSRRKIINASAAPAAGLNGVLEFANVPRRQPRHASSLPPPSWRTKLENIQCVSYVFRLRLIFTLWGS